MGQVPDSKNSIGIIGDGRMARHMAEYLRLEGIAFKHWSRRISVESNHSAFAILGDCQTILVLIKDSEIENFISENKWLEGRMVVHFSGALVSTQAFGIHPLMTFGERLYSHEFYKQIPFIIESHGLDFKDVFPQLGNPHFEIEKSQKPLYHALCVLSGNFTTILWQKFFSELREKFSLDASVAFPYLKQITQNLIDDSTTALTGPLSRRDSKTINKNLESLHGDSYQEVYRAFVKTSFPEFKEI
jgi:predicted short-subunit dehydrogenase-like oxidoreductase (DUF2520 family)